MHLTTALFLLTLSPDAPAAPQTLTLQLPAFGSAAPQSTGLRSFSGRLRLDDTRAHLAQGARQTPPSAATPAPAAQSAPATGTATPAPAAEAPAEEAQPTAEAQPAEASGEGSGCAEACDIDCETCREADRMAQQLMRHRGRVLRTHRAFAIATWGSFLATMAVGTIQAVNQDTWFGRGACSSDPNAFACRESSYVTGLHQLLAFTSTGLYVTSGVIAASAPDPENAASGDDAPSRRLALHKTLAWVHGIGMILLPVLGVLSANPQIFGVTDPEARADFGRAMRTIHLFTGYATFTALTVAGILEF
jgi:hypothetical protein